MMRTRALEKSEFMVPLPAGVLLPQEEVQERLDSLYSKGRFAEALVALETWLRSVGYFDHLTESNIFLSFEPEEGMPSLRLQVNYSRLSYKLPGQASKLSCPLCFENIGAPGKEKLRVYEFSLAGSRYFAHPTPFPLHPGHFVLNLRQHEPMRVSEKSLREAHDFLVHAPGWLLASNSDVEWAGASVLGHHHFQIFRELELPLEDASAIACRCSKGVELALLRWPAPVVRLQGESEAVLTKAASIINSWKNTEPLRCTFNYLMRIDQDSLRLFLIFRHPDFTSSEKLREIKSEGVGVIEMAGEAIVPPRPGLNRHENEQFFRSHGKAIARAIIAENSPPCVGPQNRWNIVTLLGFPASLCTSLRKEVNGL